MTLEQNHHKGCGSLWQFLATEEFFKETYLESTAGTWSRIFTDEKYVVFGRLRMRATDYEPRSYAGIIRVTSTMVPTLFNSNSAIAESHYNSLLTRVSIASKSSLSKLFRYDFTSQDETTTQASKENNDLEMRKTLVIC